MDEDESQIELKHIFEGGNVSELFFFEISNSGVDLLPARSHIFHNSVFGKRRIIAEIAVALISYTLKVYIRCVRQVIILIIYYIKSFFFLQFLILR